MGKSNLYGSTIPYTREMHPGTRVGHETTGECNNTCKLNDLVHGIFILLLLIHMLTYDSACRKITFLEHISL